MNAEPSLKAFLACSLILLAKSPSLRPVGIEEFLRKISGKVVMRIDKKDITKADDVSVGQEDDSEAAIHAIQETVNDNKANTVLLIHAENTFNSINRKVPPHNSEFTFVYKCYAITARLFSIVGKEIR